MTESKQQKGEKEPAKPSILALMLSVFAAAFGVQTDKNRERDFQQTSIVPFIIAGIVFTVLFMGGLIVLVSFILK